MALKGDYEPSPTQWARTQADVYEQSGGADKATMQGKPIIVLTTIGAKSGKLRKTPLMRVEHEGEYAVVASLGGAPNNPAWYHNMLANPQVELQDGADKREFVAREVSGAEREQWWRRSVEAFPPYAGYQVKTDRVIPVLVLSTVS